MCRIVFLALALFLCGSEAQQSCDQKSLSSNNYAYVRLTVSGALKVTSISVVNQHSQSPCTLGDSYGSIGPDVWVDKGCRADFNVCYEQGTTTIVTCESQDYKEKSCNTGKPIRILTLKSAPSDSPCIPGFSYYIQGNGVVVNKGCRAIFQVGH